MIKKYIGKKYYLYNNKKIYNNTKNIIHIMSEEHRFIL